MLDFTKDPNAPRMATVQNRLTQALDACNDLTRMQLVKLARDLGYALRSDALTRSKLEAEVTKLRGAFEVIANSRETWKQRAHAGSHVNPDTIVPGLLLGLLAGQGRLGHDARRGSNVETWIKRYRDSELAYGGGRTRVWHALDGLLDDYRAHADTGTPLDVEVQGPHGEGG